MSTMNILHGESFPDYASNRFADRQLHNAFGSIHPLALTEVDISDGIWLHQQKKSRNVSLFYAYRMFEEGGNFRNFRIAAGLETADYTHRLASDSDVYKWLEAVGYELAREDNDNLRKLADGVIDWIEAAQENDGYLMTYYQVSEPSSRWTDLANGHELYCAGHLFQAAVAYDSATNDGRLTEISQRFAKHIASIFGPAKRPGTCGHPEIEMGLIEFYRYTGNREYLDLAKFFIDQRGLAPFGVRDEMRYQNHVSVRIQRKIEGHAVRQLYLCAGVADMFLEAGEPDLLENLDAQWHDMVERKIYVTGGVGQRHDGEVIGESYELPSDRCYCETCAAVASIFWNWRMLLATGESRFADLIERTLYNAFLASYGQDGEHFFYVNPLQSPGPHEYRDSESRGGWRRARWHGTACCPPNVMRLLASLNQYIATRREDGLQIHQYISARIQQSFKGIPVNLDITTEYPWRGKVRVTVDCLVEPAWTLSLRIPDWSCTSDIYLNGAAYKAEISDGYARICRNWKLQDVVELNLTMKPQWIGANPRVDAIRGCVALQRGPLIYCLEQCDMDKEIQLNDVAVDTSIPVEEKWQNDILDGVMSLEFMGRYVDPQEWSGKLYSPVIPTEYRKIKSLKLKAIPYFAWANRQPGAMRVWVPTIKDFE